MAEALIYHFDKNDIYSCSWGVPACGPFGNNGRRACQLVELSPVLQQALEEGVAEGRDGKGNNNNYKFFFCFKILFLKHLSKK